VLKTRHASMRINNMRNLHTYLSFWPDKVMRDSHNSSLVCQQLLSLSLTRGHKHMLLDTQVYFRVPNAFTQCTSLAHQWPADDAEITSLSWHSAAL
jgi:hypothetical protein